ncbi:unnamed protein product, partial [Iphiclides podalirius]
MASISGSPVARQRSRPVLARYQPFTGSNDQLRGSVAPGGCEDVRVRSRVRSVAVDRRNDDHAIATEAAGVLYPWPGGEGGLGGGARLPLRRAVKPPPTGNWLGRSHAHATRCSRRPSRATRLA